jgi:hypothetical protein
MSAMRSLTSASISLALVVGLVAGCSAPKVSDFQPSKIFSMGSSWPWRDGESEKGIPVRIVGAWTDSVLTQPGQKPQRGFGGRLMFYGNKSDKPILVDGQLVVYAFDETNRGPTDNKPTRRYVFPADQLPLRMSESELGASYSFWLPWDEAGGPRTEVSLICRFEPKGGAVITSEQTRQLLPGSLGAPSALADRRLPQLPEGVRSRPARTTLESLRSSRQSAEGAQLASYESPAGTHVGVAETKVETKSLVPERRMRVTSIQLPGNFSLPTAAASAASAPAPSGSAPAVLQPPRRQPLAAPGPQPVVPGPDTGATPERPATSTRQKAPAAQPPRAAVVSPQLARPQFVTPQWITVQPAPIPTGVTTTVNQPAASPPAAR